MKRFFLTIIQFVILSTLGGVMPKVNIVDVLSEQKAEEFVAALKREFPQLIKFCEHNKKMIEDTGCPLEERHVYDNECWSCKRWHKR